jgi:carbon-monoxide dehydrogenase medium subunit
MKYHTPHSLSEAIRLLEELHDVRLIAGGTDVLVDIKEGIIEVENLISLQNIEELQGISEHEGGNIRIGAVVTAREIANSAVIREKIPALAEAAASMASPQIRSMATVGGNISSAVPSADLPPTLMAAGAGIRLACAHEEREILLSDFFSGPRETVCGPGEVLTSIIIPPLPRGTGISYKKFTLREANCLAVASAVSRLSLTDGKIDSASIVLGAVAPTPMLSLQAAGLLLNQTASNELFSQAAARAKEECRPISDVRGSLWLRKELVRVLVERSLGEAHRLVKTEETQGQ